VGYLKPAQWAAIIDWLEKKNYWNLGELKAYIAILNHLQINRA
jgi:hypothetical protein